MKSEDLLKAIGNIDDKFIEEAAPKINAVNETNAAESNDSAKTDDKKLVEIVKVKPRNTFRIVASIAACVCLVAAVSFAIIGSTKSRPQISDDSSCQSNEACVKENDDGISYLEDDENEKSYDKVNDNKEEIYNLKWSEKDNSQKYTKFSIDKYAYSSANTETSSEYIGEKICDTTLTGTDDDDNKQESAGEVYKINNMSDKFVVAVKFKNDDKYYVYYATDYLNSKYTPKNLGEFIDDLGLEENMNMREIGIYYEIIETNKDGQKEYKGTRYYNSLSMADVWNKLLYNRNIESLTDFSNGPNIIDGYYTGIRSGFYMTIGWELPSINFGVRNFRVFISDDDYIVFKLANIDSIAFKLSDEQIKNFKTMLDEKEYLDEEGMNLRYGWDLGETKNITPKITSSAVKAIKPGMTYSEIIHQLGKGANFGKMNMQQYIVDDEYAFVLKFDNFSDICTKSGEELLKDIVPYKKPERVESILAKDYDIFYCLVTNDDDYFVSFRNNSPDMHCALDLSNAKIEFENGEPATVDDIKFMSSLVVTYNTRLGNEPSKLYCTKVIIIDNHS